MQNWKTTLLGIMIAGLSGYTQYQSHTLNSTNISMDLAIAGLGTAAKDHNK